MKLERGPNVSGSRYIEERLSKVIGRTPDEALGVLVPCSGKSSLLQGYQLSDMVYDLKHDYLVIPVLERSSVPDDVVRGAPITKKDRTSTYSALIGSRYWSIKSGETKSQRSLSSAFVVSVLSIIRKVYGPEAMARAKEDPVGFAWEDTKELGQDAVREVASQLWQGKLAGKEACDTGAMYDGPCNARISPHLECIKNSNNNHNLYLIAGARVGSIALGYVLDRLYPPVAPSSPFCPCCRDSVQDTWGHQLSGECKATASLYKELSPELEKLMKEVAPGWGGRYWAASTNSQWAALILAAPDVELDPDDEWRRGEIAELVAWWIYRIVKRHPLSVRQRKGEAIAALQYNDRPYDH